MNNLRRPRKFILTRDQAQKLLTPYYDDLIACVQAGLTQFSALPASLRAICRPRTLANLLNDAIRDDAEKRFKDDPQMSMNLKHAGALFIFAGTVAIRFKKVDVDLLPKNVATGRQRHIAEQ